MQPQVIVDSEIYNSDLQLIDTYFARICPVYTTNIKIKAFIDTWSSLWMCNAEFL